MESWQGPFFIKKRVQSYVFILCITPYIYFVINIKSDMTIEVTANDKVPMDLYSILENQRAHESSKMLGSLKICNLKNEVKVNMSAVKRTDI